MSDLVGEGDVGHFRRNMAAVVLYSDDAGVEGFPLAIGVELTLLTNPTRAS